jgi:hypothetical protein
MLLGSQKEAATPALGTAPSSPHASSSRTRRERRRRIVAKPMAAENLPHLPNLAILLRRKLCAISSCCQDNSSRKFFEVEARIVRNAERVRCRRENVADPAREFRRTHFLRQRSNGFGRAVGHPTTLGALPGRTDRFDSAFARRSSRPQKRNVRTVVIGGVPPAILVIICHALLGERHHLLERA